MNGFWWFFFVGNLRTPINTWATFLPKNGKQTVKKGQKQVQNGIFSCCFVFVRANLENGWTDFDDSFFVGNLRTPINTWATFLPKNGKQKVKKGQKEVKMAFFHVFRPFQTISRKVIGRRRLYLVDISQIHLQSVIYNELNINSKTSGYGTSEKSDCVEKTRF